MIGIIEEQEEIDKDVEEVVTKDTKGSHIRNESWMSRTMTKFGLGGGQKAQKVEEITSNTLPVVADVPEQVQSQPQAQSPNQQSWQSVVIESERITKSSYPSGEKQEAEVPDDEIEATSNDVKRSIVKQQKWSDQKVLKMSVVDTS